MPPTEIEGLRPLQQEQPQPKDDENLWATVWRGIVAMSKLSWRGLVIFAKISWDIMQGLLRWSMNFAKSMEKKQEKEYQQMKKELKRNA